MQKSLFAAAAGRGAAAALTMRLVGPGDERAARLDCIAAYAQGGYFNVGVYDRDISLPWLNAIGPTERGAIGWMATPLPATSLWRDAQCSGLTGQPAVVGVLRRRSDHIAFADKNRKSAC
ncbi:hypothetical protein B0O95_1046 [Mycetohabitans endofungorum]|uniref:Uncharacterized protein n=1 Tax=Mycetohabitans endofungorum TaxID=417203 RepID=A0A2P5KBG5_9BURK|nr:hypothetical protein B0O95_1046 [Mycetohabitans endofungorum]